MSSLFSDSFSKDWNGTKEQNDSRSPEWGKAYISGSFMEVKEYAQTNIDLP